MVLEHNTPNGPLSSICFLKMMSSSLEKLPSYYLEERVEVHENERAWIGGGFSKAGLLPNDRGRYSTADGTLSWKTLEEAQTALLGKGWTYDSGKIDSSMHNEKKDEEDEDGDNNDDDDAGEKSNEEGSTSEWFYARDFTIGAIASAKTTRGTLHWVRFRRLTRTKVIDATQFAPKEIISKCDYCDSDATDQLSQKLLDVLTFITLVNGPASLTAAVAIPAKASIVELLDPTRYVTDTGKTTIKAAAPAADSSAGNNEKAENEKEKEKDAACYPALVYLGALQKSLEHLADTERNHPIHLLSQVGSFHQQREDDPLWIERSTAVTNLYFSKAERDAMAGWMIRALDPDFQLHCNQKHCGEEVCPFSRTKCPNPGCPKVLSTIHLPFHDIECSYKLIRCDCGDEIQRQQRGQHLRSVCPLRDVTCPFSSVGCSKVLLAQSLPNHVSDDNTAHLLLILDRMMEMQSVIRDLNGKVQRLQAENQELKTQVEDNVKGTKLVDNKATAIEKKLHALDATTKKELKKLLDTKSHVK